MKITQVTLTKPERQKRSEKIMASIDDAISTNTSMACPASDRNTGDDNRAADKGRKPLSCFNRNILNINMARHYSRSVEMPCDLWDSKFESRLAHAF